MKGASSNISEELTKAERQARRAGRQVDLEERKTRLKKISGDLAEARGPLKVDLQRTKLKGWFSGAVFFLLGAAVVLLLDWTLAAFLSQWWRMALSMAFVLGTAYVAHLLMGKSENPPTALVVLAIVCFTVGTILLNYLRGELVASASTQAISMQADPRQLYEMALQAQQKIRNLGIASFMFLVAGLDIAAALAGAIAYFRLTYSLPLLELYEEQRNLIEEIAELNAGIVVVEIFETADGQLITEGQQS